MLASVSGVRTQCSAASGAQRRGAVAPVGPFSQRRCTVSGVSRTLRFDSIRTHAVDGGVIDKPITSEKVKQSNSTLGKKPPIYKVMLHNDNFNRREYVVKVLLKVVDGLHVDDAVNVMQEAHINGIALVIACGQDKAEEYVESLRLNGLVSTLEPGR